MVMLPEELDMLQRFTSVSKSCLHEEDQTDELKCHYLIDERSRHVGGVDIGHALIAREAFPFSKMDHGVQAAGMLT